MSGNDLVSLVGKTWIHSHEEDQDGKRVFRTDGYSFPPSRGRRKFTTKSGGQLIDQPIRSRDGLEANEGSWEIENDKLFFKQPLQNQPYQVWQLIAVERDRVVVVRVEPTELKPNGPD